MSKNLFSLHPGDILLFRPRRRGTSLEDWIIIQGQKLFRKEPKKADFTHVALVANDTQLMLEAVWPKTRLANIAEYRSKTQDIMQVYRVNNISKEQINLTLNWAYEHLDEWYDIPLFLTGWLSWKHAEICSTFVSHSFKAAGLDIPYGVATKKFIVPDDFYTDHSFLKRIV